MKREDAPNVLATKKIALLKNGCLERVELENPPPLQPLASFINTMSNLQQHHLRQHECTKRTTKIGEVLFKDLVAELPHIKAECWNTLNTIC